MFDKLTSLFLQNPCLLCDRVTPETICPACDRQLQRQKFTHPAQFWQGDLPLFVWGEYNGILKRAIATLKYQNKPEIATHLGFHLADAWRTFAPTLPQNKFIIVPIPMHAEKLKKRGFNQAELIGRSFCQASQYRLNSHLLSRQKATQAMFGLSAKEREQNIKEAFKVKPSHRKLPPVLLLDDIYTTGATARTAAAILRQNHLTVTGILAIATSLPEASKI